MIGPAVVRLLESRRVRWAIGGLVATETLLVLAIYLGERTWLKAGQATVTYSRGDTGPYWWRYEKEGIAQPATRTAETAGLADGEEVVGVVVAGRARAYWVKALSYPPQHLINDVIGEHPVSVAYCNLSDCTRVYTKNGASEPLQLASVGLRGEEMIVKVGNVQYFHQSGEAVNAPGAASPFPYERMPWMRTTWKQWRAMHPSTDVYVGEHNAPLIR